MKALAFQWSHFFSEMDRGDSERNMNLAIDSFNGATSFQKWIGYPAGVKADLKMCFNGATSFQKWIGKYGFLCRELLTYVSMEPLLFRNG